MCVTPGLQWLNSMNNILSSFSSDNLALVDSITYLVEYSGHAQVQTKRYIVKPYNTYIYLSRVRNAGTPCAHIVIYILFTKHIHLKIHWVGEINIPETKLKPFFSVYCSWNKSHIYLSFIHQHYYAILFLFSFNANELSIRQNT